MAACPTIACAGWVADRRPWLPVNAPASPASALLARPNCGSADAEKLIWFGQPQLRGGLPLTSNGQTSSAPFASGRCPRTSTSLLVSTSSPPTPGTSLGATTIPNGLRNPNPVRRRVELVPSALM